MGITVQGNFIVKGDQINDYGVKVVYGSEKKKEEGPLTIERLKEKVDCIRNRLESARLWFSVCKYMMWEGLCADGDFVDAVEKLQPIYPEVKFNAKDLASLNVLSLRKPLEEWRCDDSPFKDETTFNKYKNIADTLYLV